MSKIEWTEKTWNPIAGCSVLSPGCTNCYAMRMAARIEAMGSAPHYAGTTKIVNGKPVWTGKIAIAPEHTLLEPLKRKVPTTYFVNSMSDLFHEDVPVEVIDRVFAVMALTPQHTYQVLTKRSKRMQEYFLGKQRYRDVHPLEDRYHAIDAAMDDIAPGHWCKRELQDYSEEGLPLPNVWLGVSAERQKEADERVPDLLDTPAALRFVSAEPLLGPIDFTRLVVSDGIHRDAMQGWRAVRYAPGHYENTPHVPDTHLDWIIVGGESGPGARPMHTDWARSIRAQCNSAGVAFFFKQFGSWAEVLDRDRDDPDWRHCDTLANKTPGGQWLNLAGGCGFHGERVLRVVPTSKKAAGRLLDGREWNEMPTLQRNDDRESGAADIERVA